MFMDFAHLMYIKRDPGLPLRVLPLFSCECVSKKIGDFTLVECQVICNRLVESLVDVVARHFVFQNETGKFRVVGARFFCDVLPLG